MAQGKVAMKEIVPFVKNYWGSPMEATRDLLTNGNMPLSIALVAIYALMAGLSLYFSINHFLGMAISVFSAYGGTVEITLPLITTLGAGIIIGLVAVALSVGVMFCILKLSKIEVPLNAVLMAIFANTVPFTILTVLNLLCVFMGLFQVVLVLALLSLVLWIVLGMAIATQVFGVRFTGLTALVGAVLTLVMFWGSITANMNLQAYAIGTIESPYGTLSDQVEDIVDELGEVMDQLMEMDASDIMNMF